MRNIDSIIAELDDSMGWERQFRQIKQITAEYDLPCKSAKMPENKVRNRYRDVSPYDHNRVKLIGGENDYINGSLVEVPDANRKYILAQGPLNHTAGHFWQMVWEQESAAVIMLNKIIEKGTVKCSQYYPLGDEPLQYKDTGFTVSHKRQQDNPNYTVRYLELKNERTGEVRDIYQFHYTAWPDFGVPESPAAFLDFLNCVRDCGVLESNVGPAVIHCSAGIGRSGTFVLVDSCLIFIEKDIPFDIKETLLELRRYRMGLIQTAYQLRFSYCAIAEGARAMIDAGADDSQEGSEPTEDSGPNSPYDSSDDETRPSESSTQENGSESSEKDSKAETRKRPAEDDDSNQQERHEEKKGKQGQSTSEDNPADGTDDMPSLPPPPPPPRKESLRESNNNQAVQEIRKRKISERQEALRNHVNDVKSKMKDSERKQNYSWVKLLIGGSVIVTVCTAALYFFHR